MRYRFIDFIRTIFVFLIENHLEVIRILYNASNARSGGALQVAYAILEEWKNYSNVSLCVVASSELYNILIKQDYQDVQLIEYPEKITRNFKSINQFRKKMKAVESRFFPHVAFTVFGPAWYRFNCPHLSGFANGYYLFTDSTFIKNHIKGFVNQLKYYVSRMILFKELKNNGAHFWVETQIAKDYLQKILLINQNKIIVVGNTYGGSFEREFFRNQSERSHFKLLFVSAYYPHKQLEIIQSLIPRLKKTQYSIQFILTLEEQQFQQLFSEYNNDQELINLGPQEPQQLPDLYQQCDALFLPSLLETFSANYPEAMKSELPILTSDLPFAHEVCGDAALYFNPFNIDDIVTKILELVSDFTLQQALVDNGRLRLKLLETPQSRAHKLYDELIKISNRCVV